MILVLVMVYGLGSISFHLGSPRALDFPDLRPPPCARTVAAECRMSYVTSKINISERESFNIK